MKRGFTLVELLAVVLIMGILTAIALPQYRRSVERARIAEAMQMLPAIYDARERLMTEREWFWNMGNIGQKLSFSKLDIDMKGTLVDNNTWKTENFSYNLSADCNMPGGSHCVTAQITKGSYKGVMLFYEGGEFGCCPGSAPADSCSRLNVDRLPC